MAERERPRLWFPALARSMRDFVLDRDLQLDVLPGRLGPDVLAPAAVEGVLLRQRSQLPIGRLVPRERDELLRPIVLFGQSPAARARETGVPERTLLRKAARFDAHGCPLGDAQPLRTQSAARRGPAPYRPRRRQADDGGQPPLFTLASESATG